VQMYFPYLVSAILSILLSESFSLSPYVL